MSEKVDKNIKNSKVVTQEGLIVQDAPKSEPVQIAAVPESDASALTIQAYIANAPTEFKDELTSIYDAHQLKVQNLLNSLESDKRCTFPQEFLKTQSLCVLEKIDAMVKSIPDTETKFDARAVPAPVIQEDLGVVKPLRAFEKTINLGK